MFLQDGVFVVMQYPDIIRGYDRAILTPNVNEFRNLLKSLVRYLFMKLVYVAPGNLIIHIFMFYI